MDVTRSETVPAWRRLLEDGSPVTGATIVLDIRRAGDGFVVDWADSTLKALGPGVTRYLSVPQVSATDHPGLYQVLVDLNTVSGVSDVAQDSLIVTFYEVTAGPTYTPIDDERWHVRPSPLTGTEVEVLLYDVLDPIMGVGFDTATDSLVAIRDRGDAAWTTADVSGVPAAVWATAYGAPSANSFGWLLWRLGQWGTEIAQKRIVGQSLVLKSLDGLTTYATVPLKDVGGDPISPAAGEPAQFLPAP